MTASPEPAGAAKPAPGQELSAPDPALDHFERLGLAPGVDVDRDVLERNYLERSAAVHPDRYVRAASRMQRYAMEHAAAVNEAYATLRDRTRRCEYLVKLAGIDLDSSDTDGGAPQPSQAFLIEMIDRREGLDAARASGPDALEELRDATESERDDAVDAAADALTADDIEGAARGLVTARYLARLVEEIETALEGPQ